MITTGVKYFRHPRVSPPTTLKLNSVPTCRRQPQRSLQTTRSSKLWVTPEIAKERFFALRIRPAYPVEARKRVHAALYPGA